MEQICRLCLAGLETDGCLPVGNRELKEKLETVFRFPIAERDSLPELVCIGCSGRISEFYTYCQQVESNQERLCQRNSDRNAEAPVDVVKSERMSEDDDNRQTVEWDDGSGRNEDTDNSEMKAEASSSDPPNAADCETVMVKLKRLRRKADEKSDVTKPDDTENKLLREFFRMECALCSKCFETFGYLKTHYRREHGVRGYLKCCGRTFYQRCKLVEHVSGHMGSSLVSCEVCNKSFSSRSYLMVHKSKLHGREEDRPYKCTQCKQSFAMECHLRAHMVSHVSVQCSVCGKELASSLSLRGHMVNMHGHRENHICDTCGKEFRTRQSFERHMKVHRGLKPEEQVQCSVCSKWFATKRALKTHIKIIHNEAGQVFRCDECEQVCMNSRALKNHKQRVHVEERFECEVCGKRFKRKLYLKEHVALHTGMPLYSCDICGVTFNSNANMYSHRKNKHPVEWEAKRKLQNAVGDL